MRLGTYSALIGESAFFSSSSTSKHFPRLLCAHIHRYSDVYSCTWHSWYHSCINKKVSVRRLNNVMPITGRVADISGHPFPYISA